jgi:hypothetical protein
VGISAPLLFYFFHFNIITITISLLFLDSAGKPCISSDVRASTH